MMLLCQDQIMKVGTTAKSQLMNSTEASSDTYYGIVRAFLEVYLAYCEEELDIRNFNWR